MPQTIGFIINLQAIAIQDMKTTECGYIYIAYVKQNIYGCYVIWYLNCRVNHA